MTIFRILYAGDDISLCGRNIAISDLLLATVFMDFVSLNRCLLQVWVCVQEQVDLGWSIYYEGRANKKNY